MARHGYYWIAGAIAFAMASPAGAAEWKGADGYLYDTLSACFKNNYSCRLVGRLVKVDSAMALAKANASLKTARVAGSAIVHYIAEPPAWRQRGERSLVSGGSRGGGAPLDKLVAGCLTPGGDVHKPPCGKKDAKILVDE